MNLHIGTQKSIIGWLENQILLNVRVFRYGVVACSGIVVNLGTLALSPQFLPQRGWIPSALATIASTISNFVFHNLWTFSDRQHQGLRMVRGFLSFALMSGVGICITTVAYVGFTRTAAHLDNHESSSRRAWSCSRLSVRRNPPWWVRQLCAES